MQNYKQLTAWRKVMLLVKEVYGATKRWPREELYGLTGQVRRAAVSIPSNIAEGQGRFGNKEFLHHLSIANGSLHEVETHLLIALELEYIDPAICTALTEQTAEVGRLIYGLMRSIRSRGASDSSSSSDD